MALRQIRIYGDRLLRKKSKPVKDVDEKICELLDDMIETMNEHNGLGLSAPQVGILKRVAVIDALAAATYYDEEEDAREEEGADSEAEADTNANAEAKALEALGGKRYLELINPEIIETEGLQEESEGCLSLPGKSAAVLRPEWVKVRAMNRDGEVFEVEGRETLAIALCHEIDHLEGTLYVDRIEDPETLDQVLEGFDN